ncbi:protein Star-like isoform X2 [Daphnia pulex]|uniref:protein Star-like isoform X2 n=1 Tax=Daphnia pulex TaxID=6669 RepID=UPI001EDE8A84|nr:protein Star-like isoform X2 [Daphnia pulex]
MTKYNLIEDTYGDNWAKTSADKYLDSSFCTIEYANEKKLQQDHPCLIQLIRDKYLLQPASKELPYVLNHPETIDPSNGQANDIREILKNKTKGFFAESGGFNGEFLSNTFFMERYLDWNGLLIEADQKSFSKLLSRNRKAFSLPNCISTKPYPIKVLFNGPNNAGGLIVETLEANNNTSKSRDEDNNDSVYTVQCFPFYSILLAVGRTDVDYFGLDVEGSEYKILETIPWHKVNIKTMTVEWNHIPEGEPALTRLMESNNYKKFRMISLNYSREVIYVHESVVVRK